MSERADKVRTVDLPCYSDIRQLLTILDGVPRATVTDMLESIWAQTGTPQNPVDWSDPDTWIRNRLIGDQAQLALHIWQESKHSINPRYVHPACRFINNLTLLKPDARQVYRLTERGAAFLRNDANVIREIDDAEGLLHLLAILATKAEAQRSDLLPEWGEFLSEYSKFGTPAASKASLRHRLLNLVERGLVKRQGNTYTITSQGIEYVGTGPNTNPKQDLARAISAYNEREREALRKRLGKMDPYRFEQLVRDLLEAMGYDNVEVTRESGDKGVDVVATVQFGITTIREVVQVKRHQGNIGRPVLDQLRGALPYHKAIRGTLITLGNFSQGCVEVALYPGAAPIGLINGEKLLDLLIEHEIGIRKRPAVLYDLDEDYFVGSDERGQVDSALSEDSVSEISDVEARVT